VARAGGEVACMGGDEKSRSNCQSLAGQRGQGKRTEGNGLHKHDLLGQRDTERHEMEEKKKNGFFGLGALNGEARKREKIPGAGCAIKKCLARPEKNKKGIRQTDVQEVWKRLEVCVGAQMSPEKGAKGVMGYNEKMQSQDKPNKGEKCWLCRGEDKHDASENAIIWDG